MQAFLENVLPGNASGIPLKLELHPHSLFANTSTWYCKFMACVDVGAHER